MTQVTFENAQQVLQLQPFSAFLGTQLTVFEAGRAELHLPIKPEFYQQHGFIHGGIISYLADNVLTFAGGSVLGAAVVTSEYKINYLRPAMGDLLIARATVLHHGRRQAVVRCDVLAQQNEAEILCATALGTIQNANVDMKETPPAE